MFQKLPTNSTWLSFFLFVCVILVLFFLSTFVGSIFKPKMHRRDAGGGGGADHGPSLADDRLVSTQQCSSPLFGGVNMRAASAPSR